MWKTVVSAVMCCCMLNGCIIVNTRPSAEEQQQAELRYYQQMMATQAANGGNYYRYPVVGQQPHPNAQHKSVNDSCCNGNDDLTRLNNNLESLISKINNRDFGIK